MRAARQGLAIVGGFFLACVLCFPSGAFAQKAPVIENLGASAAWVDGANGDWLISSVWETFAGEDLNGDGDQLDEVVHVRSLATGETRNLGLAGWLWEVSADWLVLGVLEGAQGGDLNGDGDAADIVVHVCKLSTGETRNLRLAHGGWMVSGDWLVLEVREAEQGQDLNGDGDREDRVFQVHRLPTGETTSLRLAVQVPEDMYVPGDWLVLYVDELAQGEDLNGDGDKDDTVVQVHRLPTGETTNLGLAARVPEEASFHIHGDWLVLPVPENWQGQDLNADGDKDDTVVHVHSVPTGETRNLMLVAGVGFVSGERLLLHVSEAERVEDLNGDGDMRDVVVHVYSLRTGEMRNLRLAAYIALVSGDFVMCEVPEAEQGTDLNGDGDTKDRVSHVYNLSTGETRNLGLAGLVFPASGGWLWLWVSEESQGEDLNGDGDKLDRVLYVHNLSTGETTNLRLVASQWAFSGDWLVLEVPEVEQGGDLNGDGDAQDRVFEARNLSTGETRNLGLAASWWSLSEDRLVLLVPEAAQGKDLNGDGDAGDYVAHVHDLAAGETRNLMLAAYVCYVSGGWLVLDVWEPAQGADLNDDRDAEDSVLHVHALSTGETRNLRVSALNSWVCGEWLTLEADEGSQHTDLNGDGDREDQVAHVHNLSTGETTNLGLAGYGFCGYLDRGDWLTIQVSESAQGADLSGDGDREDDVFHIVDLTRLGELKPRFRRGDSNADAAVNIADAIFVLSYLFLGQGAPPCLEAADANDDSTLDITDGIHILGFLFLGDPAPSDPGSGACGPDPEGSGHMTCLRYDRC